jgi:outer membrane protein assembly factor BamD
MKTLRLALLLLSVTFVSCATEQLKLSDSAEKDYHKAERLIENEEYTRASLFLEKFSAKYPYSKYARDAEFLRMKSAYKGGEHILSEVLAQRFIKAHPDSDRRIDAEYLLAKSFYAESSPAKLDQSFSHKALDAFVSIKQRFPSSKYTTKVNAYITELTNRVAEHELIVGKFYYDKAYFVAAANRFIFVKNNYKKAEAAEESLYWLASSYTALKQENLAKETSTLLAKEFPNSHWLKRLDN